ncbi:MAG TPA: serine/threonine-protein kinase [Gemmataceae bacterium]|nr:serine/threonine-protein kinase [Gemmataceae bacterium]
MPDLDRLPGHLPSGGSAPEPDCSDVTKDFSTPEPASSATVAAFASPQRLKAGRFEILDEIARGGMGIVYRAHDPAVNRDVAVKVLQERFRNHAIATSRFLEEGQITGQLQHPGIPAVHEIGILCDGSPFLAMKLIKGVTLADQITESFSDRGRLVAVFLQVAQAVGYAHNKGVIHRDLKPANVMVGQFGEVQVMDWGLAKVLHSPPLSRQRQTQAPPQHSIIETGRSSDPGTETQSGSVLGTPAFMPPEQAGGEVEHVDERADVFGLGAVLCTILTGDPPYRDKTVEAARLRAVRGQVEDAYARLDACGADPELVALCKHCLAPDRDSRPRNAGEVAAAVSAHLAAVEDRLRRTERERAAAEVKAAEQRKRRRWQAAVAGAGMLILTLLGVGKWRVDRQAAEREKDRAVAAERDRQEASAALAQAEEALAAGDLAAAEAPLALAESRLREDSPTDLQALLATVKRDRHLVRDLREIDDLSWAPGNVSMPDPAAMASRYQAAFARYGLDVGGVDTAAAADAVRASKVSAALVAGLSEWFSANPKEPHLRPLLDQLDPNPDRAAIRSAIQAGDEGRVRALVKALDGSKVPAWFAASVGIHSMVPQEEGVRLMAAAWRAHPSDYVLAYRSSHRLWGTGEKRIAEMLAWAKVAVALRPDSPFAHNQLGHAWRAMHDWGEAEASIRRAIELGKKYPKYAGAHVNLGNMFLEKGDLNAAEANYRAAMVIDPDAAGLIYYNMGLLYNTRGDLAGAEEWYRKAVAANPKRAYFREVLDRIVRERAQLKEQNNRQQR